MAGTLVPEIARTGLLLARELSSLLGGNAVSCAPQDLHAASRDGWPRLAFANRIGRAKYLPDVVAWPADVAQVCALIELANQRRIPVVPIGGGQGANGAALAVRGGIALDLKRLAGTPRIDLAAHTVEVQAGFDLQRLENVLHAAGMTLGELPAHASGSTVGGFLATRSGGASSGQLGKAEDLLLACEAVDGTGHRLQTREGPSRGLDLNQLLLGSEGTLAVFTSARLRIALKPEAHAVLGLRFHSMASGMRALQAVMRSGLRPSISRVLDPLSAFLAVRDTPALHARQRGVFSTILKAPRLLNGFAEALGGHPLMLLQFDGHGSRAAEEAAEEAAIAKRLCEQIGVGGELANQAAAEALARSSRFEAGSARHPAIEEAIAAGAFLEQLDVAATWEKLPAVLGGLRRASTAHAVLIARVGCAYLEGASLEAVLLGPSGLGAPAEEGDPSEESDERRAQASLRGEQALQTALSAALDAGATLSHAGGVGLARQLLLPREHGEGMRQLRALKKAFDPRGILNPGKLLL